VSIAGTLKFLVLQRVTDFPVPDSPFFYGTDGKGDEGLAFFLETLTGSKRYLEYGTGGSTYLAAKHGVEFIAVDSDPFFLKSVRKKIANAGLAQPTGQTYRYGDIGLTGHWGRPIGLRSPSASRLEKFRRYSDPPAECLEGGRTPDFVLVDGRFRVACVLKAIRMLQNERGWTIAMDDYGDRPHYHVINEFANIDRLVGGRMAVITSLKEFSQEQLESAIRKYEIDPE
jgi:hypothetical protein